MRKILKKLQGFTLVEVMITVVVLGLLIGLIFQIFVTIGRIAVFIQLQRSVHNELIYMVQTIQNIVDDQNVQLTGYSFPDEIVASGWRLSVDFADTDKVYTLSRQCQSASTGCFVQLSRCSPDCSSPSSTTGADALTDPHRVEIRSLLIRKLPYDDETHYEQLLHNGFWIFLDIRIPQYDESKRRFRVAQQFEMFFTMRKYDD